jgi:hypothetical protein
MSGCPLLAAAARIHSEGRFISSPADPQVKLVVAALDVPVVADFIGQACHPDSDRGHSNNEPKHQRSPPKFGGDDNPDPKGDYAGRDQICGEPFHARLQAEREPFRSISLANFSRTIPDGARHTGVILYQIKGIGPIGLGLSLSSMASALWVPQSRLRL